MVDIKKKKKETVSTDKMIKDLKVQISKMEDGPEKVGALTDLAKLTDIRNSEKKTRNDTIEKIGQFAWTGIKVIGGIALSLIGLSVTVALTQDGIKADKDDEYIMSSDTLRNLRRDAPGYIAKSMKNTLL